MKAYVAVQKKLLLLAYALWRRQVPYEPMYSIQAKAETLLISKSNRNDKKIVPTGGTTARAAPTGSIHRSGAVL